MPAAAFITHFNINYTQKITQSNRRDERKYLSVLLQKTVGKLFSQLFMVLPRKGSNGKSMKEVRQKLTKVLAEIDQGTYIEPSRTKVSVMPFRCIYLQKNSIHDSFF